ncbi:glutathione peroxidase [Chromobacterium sp. IIBBL 290-4]|uniref:glutathione peroxidase n=1 Tax=Chromobacterium sp. IIBBL 290-4 TaxID=2953890 RepID=UPI0020B87419|nr:glutathione peroxidase [Chromobacterium sp. IIBBL 290-4]UTH72305.1 glutathione peroxidase [Chromobacterium sp. IIBBL 290-4]
MTTLYDFNARRLDGSEQPLEAYRGQVTLLVNTASECGYTRQYAGLQELHDFFAGQGFAVLGFPCNQFGGQEPGGETEIAEFCQSRFGVAFPLFAKLDVNGDGAHPLWRWLTQADSPHPHPIKWNFTKFLIDARGRVVKRYEPAVEPHELVDDIKVLLAR